MLPSWHSLSIAETLHALHVKPDGLTSAQALERRQQFGLNQLVERKRPSIAALLLGQFKDVMIMILLAAAMISGLLGEFTDSFVILVIILLNAVIGVIQEYRAEKAIVALRALSIPVVKVLRDGTVVIIQSTEVVPGDRVVLEAGNLVCADIRLSESAGLEIDESLLTGESSPSIKQTDTLPESDLPIGDRSNLVFRGTHITHGRGEGIVVATGMQTEIGRIATLLETAKSPLTPLQKRLSRFGQVLSAAVVSICAIVFFFGLLRGESTILMFLTAVSLAVAAVPEALPAIVTISLALGARLLIQHNALIRHLPAVETLGSVTYICADKTGTLTRNRMRVEKLFADERLFDRKERLQGETLGLLLRILALNNDSQIDQRGKIQGEPTELALLRFVRKIGLDPDAIRKEQPRRTEIPFDATRRMMTTLHDSTQGLRLYTKGAPEHVLERCFMRLSDQGLKPIDRSGLHSQVERMAEQGYRVLAVAYRDCTEMPSAISSKEAEHDLIFIGLVGLMDPPHHGVIQAVHSCICAGITPVMITGDHPATANAIAQRLGIAYDGDRLLTGRELDRLSDEQLQEIATDVRIYARVAPEQKIRIVTALQERDEFVAMTGDGVNDAPALRQADIGVAMGKNGTDVAREASHMVLLDDNFATIVEAVSEGRRIFDNIRKFIRYTMTSNSGEIWTLFLAPFLGMPLPLLPIQILWINLVTDGLPGLALSLERKESHIMKRPPRPPNESILSGGMPWHILWIGLLIGGLSLATQALALATENPHWQTMVFTVLTFTQLCHVLAIRSERLSLFSRGFGGNPALLASIVVTIILQLGVIYIPVLRELFKLQPLSADELLYCMVVSMLVIPAVELEKSLIRHGVIYTKRRRIANAVERS
jgi:Ca2+-transporting ATPase